MKEQDSPESDLPGDEWEVGLASKAFRVWFAMRLREGKFSQEELLRILFPEWQDRPPQDPEDTSF